jgi:hypothetical protein
VNTATEKYRNCQETFDFSDRTDSGTRPATAGATGTRGAGTRQMVVNYLEAHQMRALSAPGREAMMSHFAPRIIQTERGFVYLCALPVEP